MVANRKGHPMEQVALRHCCKKILTFAEAAERGAQKHFETSPPKLVRAHKFGKNPEFLHLRCDGDGETTNAFANLLWVRIGEVEAHVALSFAFAGEEAVARYKCDVVLHGDFE